MKILKIVLLSAAAVLWITSNANAGSSFSISIGSGHHGHTGFSLNLHGYDYGLGYFFGSHHYSGISHSQAPAKRHYNNPRNYDPRFRHSFAPAHRNYYNPRNFSHGLHRPQNLTHGYSLGHHNGKSSHFAHKRHHFDSKRAFRGYQHKSYFGHRSHGW